MKIFSFRKNLVQIFCKNTFYSVCLIFLVNHFSSITSSYIFTPIASPINESQNSDSSAMKILNLTHCNLGHHRSFEGFCWCTPLMDIKCINIEEVPPLAGHDPLLVYGGIYLAKQKISTLPQNAFKNLQVRKIVLNSNNISEKISSHAFSGLGGVLKELYMGDCNLKQVPDKLLRNMTELRHLHLWANQIPDFPGTYFHDCRKLTELILWGNKIKVIKHNMFEGLFSLKKLDLDKNMIRNIETGAFKHLSNIEIIHLGENEIVTVTTEMFAQVGNLRVLNLDANKINIIYPQAFSALTNLTSLSLNNNDLNMLPGETFSGLTRLTALFLHRNTLGNLWANMFKNQRLLYLLNLSHNKFEDIPDGVFKLNQRLRIFYFDNNLLKTIQRNVFDSKPDRWFKVLSLFGNPLKCDCKMAWLAQLKKNSSVSVLGVCSKSSLLEEDLRYSMYKESTQKETIHSITDFGLYENCTATVATQRMESGKEKKLSWLESH